VPPDTVPTKEVQLDEVTIEANRNETEIDKMPSSVQILGRERIQGAQATLSLEESLRRIPGVYVNNRFNFAQGDRISIRGIGSRSQFGVRGIKMILDGIPLTFPDGQSQLNNIDISSLGKIEIIKGASSVLYGNSSGGVIFLRSENPASEKLILTPSFLMGSYGLRKAQMKFSGRLNKFSYLVNTDRTEYDGYRDFSSSLFYNLNSNLKYHFNENSSLTLIVNGNDSPYLLNPGSLDKKTAEETPATSRKFNQLQGAGKITRQLQSGLSYSLKLKGNQKVDVTAYGVVRDLYNPIPGRIVDLARETSGFRASYNKQISLSSMPLNLTAGYDYENQLDKRKEFENLGISEEAFVGLKGEDIINKAGKGDLLVHQNESIIGNGVFAKVDLDIIEKLTFTAGARFDNYRFKVTDKFLSDNSDNSGNKNLQQVNPSFGLVYRLDNLFNFYTNYSSAFQTPSANEFGNLPSGAGGFNKDLKPEKIKSIEGGIRGNFSSNFIT
jgi:iron complex outermembrane receptor protein